MTDDRIRELAAKHAAYADSTLTLRGDAVVAFARDVEKLVLEGMQPKAATWSIDPETGCIVVSR